MSNRMKPRNERARRHDVALSPEVQAHVQSIDDANPVRVNAYRCPTCFGIITSVDMDAGVTPMFSPCFATEGCTGNMVSAGYPQHVDLIDLYGAPTLEWFRPDALLGLSLGEVDHVRKGGLVRRASAAAPKWVKELAG